jgi:hypothetical protein
MKSWKTTVAGIGGFLALLGPALAAQFDNDPLTVPQWGLVFAAAIAAWGLIKARDNDVTSEEAGAKK